MTKSLKDHKVTYFIPLEEIQDKASYFLGGSE